MHQALGLAPSSRKKKISSNMKVSSFYVPSSVSAYLTLPQSSDRLYL